MGSDLKITKKLIQKIIKEELKSVITEKAEFAGFDSQTLGQLQQTMKKASANYGNWHINANEFLWNVDTSTGDGKDASHKGGKIAGFEKESTNRGRREKSRLKK